MFRISMNYDTQSGSIDRTFNRSGVGIPSSKPNPSVNTIIATSDKIIIGGNFVAFNGKNVNCLTRLYNGIGYFPLVKFMGETYDKLFVGSNSYLTFGHGSSVYGDVTSFGGGNPPYPGIFINAGDRSYQRVTAVISDDEFTIRYQGGVGTEWNMLNVPQVDWSVTFNKNGDDIYIDIFTIDGEAGPSFGFTAIKDATSVVRTFKPTVSRRYVLYGGYAVKNEKAALVKFEADTDISGLVTTVSTSKTITYDNAVVFFQNKANNTGETFLPGMMYIFSPEFNNNYNFRGTFLNNTLKYYMTVNLDGSYGYGQGVLNVPTMFAPRGFYIETITIDCNDLSGSGFLYTSVDLFGQINSVSLIDYNNNYFISLRDYPLRINADTHIVLTLDNYYSSGTFTVEIVLKNISY